MKNKLTIYAVALIIVVGCVIGGFAMASYFDIPGLRNVAGTQINPATEETSQTIFGGINYVASSTKAEDSGHTTGDRGFFALGVRNEGLDDFSGTDKDYIPFALDAKGHLFVRLSQEEGENSVYVSSTNPLVVLANPNGIYPVSQSGTWNLNNISGTISLPTGASTAALQTTLNDYVYNVATSTGAMASWNDAGRAKISNRLVVDFYSSSTISTSAVLVFDASAHTDTMSYCVTNNDTAEVYLAHYAFLTITDFETYLPPYQKECIQLSGNATTADDLYAIHDTGDSGPLLVTGYKYK